MRYGLELDEPVRQQLSPPNVSDIDIDIDIDIDDIATPF
jgi:hypothetical protein